MRNNKKAQSEIITTVLIILLVLAAIVIVWQVVSRTIGNARQGILTQEQCIGLDLQVISATAQKGACLYTQPVPAVATCDDVAEATISGIAKGGPTTGAAPVPSGFNCPAPPVGCGALISWTGSVAAADQAKILVMRNAGTSRVESITPKLFLNGVTQAWVLMTSSPTTPTVMKTLESAGVSGGTVNDIKTGDKVKVAAIIDPTSTTSSTVCGESGEITVA